MTDVVIHGVDVVTGDLARREITRGWVHLSEGRVRALGSGAVGANLLARYEAIDATALSGEGGLLTPGLVDIHTHGGGGASFDDAEPGEAVARIVEIHERHGVTRLVASLVSARPDVLVARVRALDSVLRATPGAVGIHLEGPCLDHGHRGAHDPAALVPVSALDVAQLTAAGTLAQVTLAPELPEAETLVRDLVAAGVTVALGHTGADADIARRAFDAGATLITHAFNAMPPVHHRAPGPVGAALADDRVVLELIADGVHVHGCLFAPLFRAAPRRIALVSDAMAAAGADDGDYRLGPLAVTVSDGVARLRGTDTIAGSTLTLDRAVRNAVSYGVPRTDAVEAATVVPATAIRRSDLGRLVPGARADVVLWDSCLHVRAVWRDGMRVC